MLEQTLAIDFNQETASQQILPGLPLLSSYRAGWDSIYLEYQRGITVNSVLPGATSPGMFDNLPPERREAAASSPFGRIGQAQDIADAVAFLVSEEARWIT